MPDINGSIPHLLVRYRVDFRPFGGLSPKCQTLEPPISRQGRYSTCMLMVFDNPFDRIVTEVPLFTPDGFAAECQQQESNARPAYKSHRLLFGFSSLPILNHQVEKPAHFHFRGFMATPRWLAAQIGARSSHTLTEEVPPAGTRNMAAQPPANLAMITASCFKKTISK
jgi:hypothetical protein